jgi:uncharacterized protein (TIGR00297 family)
VGERLAVSLLAAIAIGLLVSVAIAFGGYRARALTIDGALAAIVVGTAVFGFGGLRWAAVMVGFFVLSSALSRVGRRRKRSSELFVEKGSRRDAVQVLANGGVAALLAVAHQLGGVGNLFPAFLGAMAAATADTWSTEIGSLSASPPRSILTGKIVEPGSSGGVTLLGMLAALGGGLAVGLIGGGANSHALRLILVGAVAGLAGSVADSLLGASIQRMYRCPNCLTQTERRVHGCGTATVPVRGLAAVNNDTVNGLTTLIGAACGALFSLLLA